MKVLLAQSPGRPLGAEPRRPAYAFASLPNPEHPAQRLRACRYSRPLALLWALAWVAVRNDHWWGVLFTLPAAAFLVRLFMVQHDCGHGAFFRQKALNDWVGRAISVLTLTPYDSWRQVHALHHATAGNLDKRGQGDVDTLTVDEYLALPRLRRAGYRLFRHPAVMFGLGPVYVFLLRHRLPLGGMRGGWTPWLGAMATNLVIAVGLAAIVWTGGLRSLLLVQLPITLVASAIGVWLFYVQHQFEGGGVDTRLGLAVRRRRPERQLSLPPARRAGLVHGQHRGASRAPPVQPHPILSAARSAARPSRTGRPQAVAGPKPAWREPGPVG